MTVLMGSMVVAGGVWAGTLGYWTFEGTPGNTIAAETTFVNQIDGTTLPLRSGDRYGNAESAGRLSSFVAPCGDAAHMYVKPTRVGTETPLASAYRIASAGTQNGGCPLYLDDPGGALNRQSFTLEMLVRFTEAPAGWAMIASRNYHYFGAGMGTYYNGLYLIPGSWSWNFHYCCQTNENGAVGYGDIALGNWNLGDGKWHHISLRVNGDEHKVACYIDYTRLSTVGILPGPLAYDYTDGNTVERNPWVIGNHQVYGNYSWAGDLAAVRFSDQSVAVEDSMRLGSTRTDDRTLLWLPLDSDFGALANVDVSPTNGTFASGVATMLASGKATFTNCVKNVRVVDGADMRQRPENAGCLSLRGGYVDLAIKPYMLDVPNAITVEFFLNARESDIIRGGWLAFLTCRHDAQLASGAYYDNRLPFVFQENGSGAMYFRADAPGVTDCHVGGGGTLFDGTWHHVAMTIENLSSGQYRITGFIDYASLGSFTRKGVFTLEDYHFLRIGNKDKTNSTFLIDEVRISKGALGVADFLRLKGPVGTVLLFR